MAKFEIGQLVATHGVHALMQENPGFSHFAQTSFLKYRCCDWGDTCESDKVQNDSAVANSDDRIIDLYAKYFWYMELNRATKVYGAYVDGTFVGVLLAEMKNETKCHYSIPKAIYVKIFDWLQHLVAGKGVGEYDEANKDMYHSFCQKNNPDGEIVFLASDPDCKMKGIGTALLSALEKDERGKHIYLYTDNACTYQFYEHRGFERSEERQIVLDLDKKQVPLTCFFIQRKLQKSNKLQIPVCRSEQWIYACVVRLG